MATTTTLLVGTALAAVLVAAGGDSKVCSTCSCTDRLLNCTGRGLSRLPPANSSDWPDASRKFETANFDHNGLVLVLPFPPLSAVKRVSLRSNFIQKVEDSAFQNLTNLEEIDLSYNELTTAVLNGKIFTGTRREEHGSEMPLGNVTVLRLDSNSIHSLPAGLFRDIEGLRVLTLAHNPLRVIDQQTAGAIGSLQQLRVLDLSFCQLDRIPDDVVHVPVKLAALNLTGNLLTEPPSALQFARELVELHLDQNPIATLEDKAFPECLSTLKVLHLEYMPNLTRVDAGALAPLHGLEELHVTHSPRLKEIDARAFATSPNFTSAVHPPLRKLVLFGNALEHLDEDLLRNHWEELKFLDLGNNDWVCDCDSQWLVDTLEPIINDTNPHLLRNVICEKPPEMYGKSLFDLHERRTHLGGCDSGGGSGLSSGGVVLVGVLVGALLAVPATLAAVLCWRRGGLPWFSSGPAAFSRNYYNRPQNFDDF